MIFKKQTFDEVYEVRGVFLEISKAFDKVWQEGIGFKLKQNGISRNLLKFLSDFFKDKKQRVVLYGQVSNWADVTAEFPQESIRHSLLFLIYINDLLKLIADGTSLYSITHDISTSANEVNNDLAKINNWAFQWKMNLNQDSSKQAQEVIFSCKSKKK